MNRIPNALAKSLFVAALLLSAAEQSFAQFPAPELKSISQSVFAIGSETTIDCRGDHLDELSDVLVTLTSDAPPTGEESRPQGRVVCVPASILDDSTKPTSQVVFNVPAGLSPGLGEVRLQGRFGLSNSRRFLLLRSPVEHVTGPHSNIADTRAIVPGTVYSAVADAGQRRYYGLRLSQGQAVSVAAYAESLDSQCIPEVVVFAPDGRELSSARAAGAWPAETTFNADTDGDYVITVADALFRGGTDFGYTFEVGVAARESRPDLELDRLLRPDLSATQIDSRFASVTRVFGPRSITPPEPIVSSVQTVPFSRLCDLSQGAVDIEFDAVNAQQYRIEVASSHLFQLTDPRIDIYQVVTAAPAEGEPENREFKWLAESDDRGALGGQDVRVLGRDPVVFWTAPADGRFLVRVSDNDSGLLIPDAKQAIVTVSTDRPPSFQLLAYDVYPHKDRRSAKPSGLVVQRGGHAAVRVLIARDPGFSADIRITVEGLPDELSCEPVVAGAAMSEAVLVIAASETASDWSGPIRVIGRSGNDESTTSEAIPATVTQPVTSHRNATSHRLTNEMYASSVASDTTPLAVSLNAKKDDAPTEASPAETPSESPATPDVVAGEKLTVPIALIRREGAAGEITLRAQQTPGKVKINELKVAGDKSDGELSIEVAKDAAPGTYSIWLEGETKIKWRRNPQALVAAEAYLVKLNETAEEQKAEEQKAEQAAAATDANTNPPASETGTTATESTEPVPPPGPTAEQLAEAIKAATAEVERLKKETAEKDITVWIPSNTYQFRIVPPPAM